MVHGLASPLTLMLPAARCTRLAASNQWSLRPERLATAALDGWHSAFFLHRCVISLVWLQVFLWVFLLLLLQVFLRERGVYFEFPQTA